MAAVPPRPARRRPRRGSLERPLNSRLYPDAWLLVALPPLPPGFDGRAALELAQDLVRTNPDRSPGTLGSARWFREQLTPYGLRIHEDAFRATIPGRGRVTLRNLVAVVPGRSPQAIVVMAHRDDTGAGPGANDNAAGTAAARVEREGGRQPTRPSALRQLIDLAYPFSLYEQAPFVGHGIPAVTLTTGGGRPPASYSDAPARPAR